MSNSFKLHILTPERQFYLGEAIKLITESSAGRIEILANHAELIASLKPSTAELKESDGKVQKAFITDGLLKVSNNEVMLLCNSAEWKE